MSDERSYTLEELRAAVDDAVAKCSGAFSIAAMAASTKQYSAALDAYAREVAWRSALWTWNHREGGEVWERGYAEFLRSLGLAEAEGNEE